MPPQFLQISFVSTYSIQLTQVNLPIRPYHYFYHQTISTMKTKITLFLLALALGTGALNAQIKADTSTDPVQTSVVEAEDQILIVENETVQTEEDIKLQRLLQENQQKSLEAKTRRDKITEAVKRRLVKKERTNQSPGKPKVDNNGVNL